MDHKHDIHTGLILVGLVWLAACGAPDSALPADAGLNATPGAETKDEPVAEDDTKETNDGASGPALSNRVKLYDIEVSGVNCAYGRFDTEFEPDADVGLWEATYFDVSGKPVFWAESATQSSLTPSLATLRSYAFFSTGVTFTEQRYNWGLDERAFTGDDTTSTIHYYKGPVSTPNPATVGLSTIGPIDVEDWLMFSSTITGTSEGIAIQRNQSGYPLAYTTNSIKTIMEWADNRIQAERVDGFDVYGEYSYDEFGDPVSATIHAWGNLVEYRTIEFTSSRSDLKIFNGPGSDGVWFTDDDRHTLSAHAEVIDCLEPY